MATTNKIEIKMAQIDQKLKDTCATVGRIEQNFDKRIDKLEVKIDKFIDSADDKYANKDNFIFWRNILVSGIIISIFIGVLAKLLF